MDKSGINVSYMSLVGENDYSVFSRQVYVLKINARIYGLFY